MIKALVRSAPLALAMSLSVPALAQSGDAALPEPAHVDPSALEPAALTAAAVPIVAPQDAPFVATAVDGQDLARIAGREDTTQVAQSRHTATVAGNSVGDNNRTGDVAISDNAFDNLTGLSVININSGNNVAVNAAINVNISLTQPGQ